jgi:uncharacterized protein DUF4411
MSSVAGAVNSMSVAGVPYLAAAVNKFLGDADFHLVAYAHAQGHIVVTNETGHAPGQQASLKRLKIPDVCTATGVNWTTVFKMLRTEKAVFRI